MIDFETVPPGTMAALRRLVRAARTSGGTAGRDEELCQACEKAEAVIAVQDRAIEILPAL